MKKKIIGAMMVFSIVVVAMINVNLNKVNNKGDLALANVEALALDDEGSGDCVYKVNCKTTNEWEEVFYNHEWDNVDTKYTTKMKEVLCPGTGSICCTPSFKVTSSDYEYVPCECYN